MIRILITISSIFILTISAWSQASNVPLKLRKNLRDKLDDIVFEFQLHSRLSSEEESQAFVSLFSEDALVFDYINPNYLSRNIGQELNKPIEQFIDDLRRDFPYGFLQSSIVDSNLGEAVDYKKIDWNVPMISVILEMSVIADFVDGGQFSNRPILELRISFDTLQQQAVNLKINSIAKVKSELRYQKEERAPKFEKQLIYQNVNSWNTAVIDQTNGDYFIDNLKVAPDFGYGVSINLIKLLSAPEPEEFAYSIGIGYSVSNYRLRVDNYFYSFLTTDQENDAVYRNVAGTSLEESVKSELVDVPIRFRYERKLNRVFSMYGNIGLNLTYQLRSAYNGSGVFTYTGYYPKYNLLMSNVETYGYVTDRPESAVFDTRIPGFSRDQIGLSGLADLGVNIEMKSGWTIYLGATATRGIIKTKRIQDFQLISSRVGEFNGILPVVNSLNFGGYGLQIGIRKRFRSRNGLVRMDNHNNG